MRDVSLDLTAAIDEHGEIFFVVVPGGAVAPTVPEVLLGQAAGGGPVVAAGRLILIRNLPGTAVVSGLSPSTAYDIHVVAEDLQLPPIRQATVTSIAGIATQAPAPVPPAPPPVSAPPPPSPDSDGDGLTDAEERDLRTDPDNADTDDDGLTDGDEVIRGTDPRLADSDGDFLDDGFEVEMGTDPLDADDPLMHAGSDPDVFRPMFVNGVAVFNVDLVPQSLIILVLPNGNEIALPAQLFQGLGLVEFSYGTGLSEGTPPLPGGLSPVTFVRFQDLPG